MHATKQTLATGIALLLAAAFAWAEGKPVQPFNGKDLTGWALVNKDASKWVVGKATLSPTDPKLLKVEDGDGELINATQGGGSDIYTEAKFGDCRVEIEVMVPKGSNSGVYLMGEYELQVLDSFGKEKIGQGDMGSIYSASVARVNASKKPGEWQKFVVDFRAPKFDADGKKTANGKFVKVTLNGTVIHENVEVVKSTGGGITGQEHATGPLMLQGNHGPVAYRNLKLTPLN